MELMTLLVLVLSFLGAIILKLTIVEVQDWMPTFARWIINRSAAKLPKHERERFREEWLAHLDEYPGRLSKICHAVGCALGVRAINKAISVRLHQKSPSTPVSKQQERSLTANKIEQENPFHSAPIIWEVDGKTPIAAMISSDRFDYIIRDNLGCISLVELKHLSNREDYDFGAALRSLRAQFPAAEIKLISPPDKADR
jgi:hypothetical protein